MTRCQHCGRRTQNYLCQQCTQELRDNLTRLAVGQWIPDTTTTSGETIPGRRAQPWLDALTDAATGQTRLGDGGRRQTPEGIVRYADERLDETTGQRVGDDNLERDIDAGKLALNKVLAAGGVNARASTLTREIRATLTAWADKIEPIRPLDGSDTALVALWLAQHVETVAATRPDAAALYTDIDNAVHAIERIINRPIPPRFVGPCPTTVDHPLCRCARRHPHQCGVRLMAKRTAIEVTCPNCRQTHNVEAIVARLLADVDHWRFAVNDILLIMELLDEPLPARTFRRWRKEGRIAIRGWQRPDNPDGTPGSIGLTRRSAGDRPVYRLSEVRKLRSRQEVSA